MIRASFLSPMPSPYMRDLFDAMMADGRIDLRVHYQEMEAPDTLWGQVSLPDYAELLPGNWYWFGGGRVYHNPGALQRILAFDPDIVVVQGYSGITNQFVMRGLRRRGIPWMFFGERPGMNTRSTLGRAVRRLAQQPAVKWPHAIAAIGSRAQRAYQAMARCEVENIPYCCDLNSFRNVHRNCAETVRFLYCGQLIHRKALDLLLPAFLQVADRFPACSLTLVGEGPLRGELQRRIPESHSHRVTFAGFQPIEKLPQWFGLADVLVLPSRYDGWGVVVNQAIGAGLAVLCSDAVGAAEDLVRTEFNGMVFPSEDQEALFECLAAFASDPVNTRKMGARSQYFAERITPSSVVGRWHSMFEAVLKGSDRCRS